MVPSRMSQTRIPALSCSDTFMPCVSVIGPPTLYAPVSWVPGNDSSLIRDSSGSRLIQSERSKNAVSSLA